MNRREFLYTGAAAAAVASRSMDARAYSAIDGANDRVGLGVIGTGRRATDVCGGFVQDPRVQIRALADIYDKQISSFQDRFKDHVADAKVSVEYQEMLDRKDIDAVLVATPDHLHVQIAKDTLAANKNTYLEKPTLHRWSERTALIRPQTAARRCCSAECSSAAAPTTSRSRRRSSARASSATSFSCAQFGAIFPGSAASFPQSPNRPASTGIYFLVRRQRFPTRHLATAPGVPITTMAMACLPTSSLIGPMWRSGCSMMTNRSAPPHSGATLAHWRPHQS